MVSMFIFGLLLADLAYGNSLSRIIGGSDTSIKSHPYQVSLQNSYGSHKCGGSIVGSQWILTAAHCVESGNAEDFTISLNDGTLDGKYTVYDVAVIKHPDYVHQGSGAFPNNIALLKLKTRMDFNTYGHIAISLAASGQTFEWDTCTITGWGLTAVDDMNSTPNVLQETTGTVLSSDGCTSAFGSNYNHDVHMCLGNSESGTCNQDSGGPMVCSGVLAGVASWGRVGCDPSYPSVYARVSTYRQWIDDTIATN
ncbi:chymotrypsinogen A-like [Mercenaria mercenaria]|uniref:chymotrypsinogen A-like n=1 Tax=Mercenaria mercenaria TaxID=6596 RepID=UPI00234F3FD0|nr:chymotrypsinogen A-like [Mercenaria mercenaria]